MQRKFRRIFGFSKMTSQMFMNGFMMGSMVGGAFGGMIGTYFAIQQRQIMYIPMSAFGSAMSMGFFMGMGMMIRGSGI